MAPEQPQEPDQFKPPERMRYWHVYLRHGRHIGKPQRFDTQPEAIKFAQAMAQDGYHRPPNQVVELVEITCRMIPLHLPETKPE